jgi:predicted house-cleaning noncanonical NTP pyrophosphatase (MazG superfamily)
LLGHAYYMMRRTGATVIPVSAEEPKSDRTIYHKLVRDRIPVIIREAGGLARVGQLSRVDAIRLLKQKLIEEAVEVWTCDDASLAEELSDVLEVIEALRSQGGIEKDKLERVRRDKREARGGFEKLIYLEETSVPSLREFQVDESFPLFTDVPSNPTVRPSSTAGRLELVPSADSDDIVRFRMPLIPPVVSDVQSLDGKEVEIEVRYVHNKILVRVARPRRRVSSKQLALFAETVEKLDVK